MRKTPFREIPRKGYWSGKNRRGKHQVQNNLRGKSRGETDVENTGGEKTGRGVERSGGKKPGGKNLASFLYNSQVPKPGGSN